MFSFGVIFCMLYVTESQLFSSSQILTTLKTNLKDDHNIRFKKSSKPEDVETITAGSPMNTTSEDGKEEDAEDEDEGQDEDGDEEGIQYSKEEVVLHQKASLIVGAIFVPGLILIYLCCRFIPDKILMHFTGE